MLIREATWLIIAGRQQLSVLNNRMNKLVIVASSLSKCSVKAAAAVSISELALMLTDRINVEFK